MELASGLAELEDSEDGSISSVGSSSSPSKALYGELRIFYNTKFLPRLEPSLQKIIPKPPPSTSKPKSRGTRLPLRALSAQDVNVRQGNAQ